ncbi:MAG: hypothetical protein SCM88_05620 [Bacillota bacterium]|nr:hypothetical protein [Bacillota bacterium]
MMVSLNIERSIRQSMRQIDFFLETGSPESFQRLQYAMEELASGFMQWVEMNQNDEEPNERMKAGLKAMEIMRNMLVSQLERQYQLQNQQLIEPDREMLLKVHDQLGRLLLIYHNIQGRLDALNNPLVSDGGLHQLTEQILETNLLYRHSVIPNIHPSYLNADEALQRAGERSLFLAPEKITLISDVVKIREGVHVYEAFVITLDGEVMVGIDARDGNLREYKYQEPATGESESVLTLEEALVQARRFLSYYFEGQVKEEFIFNQNGTGPPLYLFRFMPITDHEITLYSDAYYITISAVDGQPVHFTNDFSGTIPPDPNPQFSMEETRQELQQESGRVLYEGISVIRNFNTRFRPRLTYSFRVIRNGQSSMIHIDIETGKSIHETYDLFKTVNSVVWSK